MTDSLVTLAYLVAASLFILGLKKLGSPRTARAGNRMAAVGMLIGVVAALLSEQILNPVELVAGEATGRYVDYPHVGASAEHGKWSRRVKLMKWVGLFRRRTQHTVRLKKQQLSDTERLQSSWDAASDWGRSTLDLFGVDVQIKL